MASSDQVPAELLLSFMLEDVNATLENQISGSTETSNDGHAAYSMLKDDLESRLRFHHDQRIGRSMTDACT